eukprot:TRINITY_DN23973_c0_g2_i1.p1 TRINITY_DN23973_c0_g2~~TRINITY_DN23973_c0_g2_i1.p1  ORF type:complete len:410 (-),score=55.03 TRINITY_DN23973_c0_g2_i1:104-1333(-)
MQPGRPRKLHDQKQHRYLCKAASTFGMVAAAVSSLPDHAKTCIGGSEKSMSSNSRPSSSRPRSTLKLDCGSLLKADPLKVYSLGDGRVALNIYQKPDRQALEQLFQGSEPAGPAMLQERAASGLHFEVVKHLEAMTKEAMEPSSVSFQAAVQACVAGGRWEQALIFLSNFGERGVDFHGVQAYSYAVQSCLKGAWVAARQLLYSMGKRGIRAQSEDYAAAMRACLWRSSNRRSTSPADAESCLQMLADMEDAGFVREDSGAVLIAGQACESGRLWERALDFVRRTPPDAEFHLSLRGSAAKASAKALAWERAIALLLEDSSECENVSAVDSATLASAAIACRSVGRWEESNRLFNAIKPAPSGVNSWRGQSNSSRTLQRRAPTRRAHFSGEPCHPSLEKSCTDEWILSL